MAYEGKRHTHIVDWDEMQSGEWSMESQQSVDDAVAEYISAANEHEDQELTEAEIKRLRDFVKYLKSRN